MDPKEGLVTIDRLAEFGCDEAQGYYISRPIPALEFTRWLSVRNLDTERPQEDPPASRSTLRAV